MLTDFGYAFRLFFCFDIYSFYITIIFVLEDSNLVSSLKYVQPLTIEPNLFSVFLFIITNEEINKKVLY